MEQHLAIRFLYWKEQEAMQNMQFEMDMRVVWISVIFSAVIGICFGLYPAWKAAAKKPIEALRYTG